MCNELVYDVQPASPEAHLFAVELTITNPPARTATVTLPAWIPGSYVIRDYAKHIVSLTAEDASGPLSPQKIDKQSWHFSGIREPLTIRYRVYAWELSVRAAHLDTTHAYFNGTCLFLRVIGLDQIPCRVRLSPPSGPSYEEWRVATTLERIDAARLGFGWYRADNYWDLIDHPVEMGRFHLLGFEVLSRPHWMAITGQHRASEERLGQDLKRICEEHASLFGQLPIEQYLFLTTAVGEGYGGLEHQCSSSLICARDDLFQDAGAAASDGYRRFLGLCSHEYFHLWHVKRIRPRALSEADLTKEAYTRDLWAYEGITSYYDDLALVRSGCIDEQAYLGLLARMITRVVRDPGRNVQSVAASSFDAWIKFYKQDENAPNAIVSYYTKGALIALALDLTLRRKTQDSRSLDDVMRALWARHGRTGHATPERGIEALASEIAGLDLPGFFDAALDDTVDLELAPLLAHVGLALRLRPARDSKDSGGLVADFDDQPDRPTLGLQLQPTASEPTIRHVLNGSPAERAGLAPGDMLTAVDGLRVTTANLDTLIAHATSRAEPTMVHAFRRDELMVFSIQTQPAPNDTCDLRILPDASPEAVQRRAAWLRSSSSRGD
jgi:predicted metalloprotease with PDZ domain